MMYEGPLACRVRPASPGPERKGEDKTIIRLGTQGLGSESWVGQFYHRLCKPRDRLAVYARVFDTLELNTTFYSSPKPSTVEAWAASTPEDFVFAAKFPRVITHEKLLESCARETAEFIEAMQHLDKKLGPLLVQLPPNFDFASMRDLEAFVRKLPKDLSFAAEFRHPSWLRTETYNLLRNNGVAWCISIWRDVPAETQLTADFAYLRWTGDPASPGTLEDRRQELLSWSKVLLDLASQVDRMYGYFNDNYGGLAPYAANELKRLLGLPIVEPQSLWPQQPSLFDLRKEPEK